MIDILPVVPDIFPTACGTIQLEYEKQDGSYLELELEEDRVKIFRINQRGCESTEHKTYDDCIEISNMVALFNDLKI